MNFPEFVLRLPGWTGEIIGEPDRRYPSLDERMGLAIALSRRNIDEGGGPFGAAIFESDSGRLIAPGVNLVIPAGCSVAHAEMVAIILAQQALGRYLLRGEGQPGYELVSTTEPCAMCLGAIPWSGVTRLVCGARDADARAIGFDEGAKPASWPQLLSARGIEVVRDIRRQEAVAVLQRYAASGGEIYGAPAPETP